VLGESKIQKLLLETELTTPEQSKFNEDYDKLFEFYDYLIAEIDAPYKNGLPIDLNSNRNSPDRSPKHTYVDLSF